jgi:hypothetical protein
MAPNPSKAEGILGGSEGNTELLKLDERIGFAFSREFELAGDGCILVVLVESVAVGNVGVDLTTGDMIPLLVVFTVGAIVSPESSHPSD